MTQLSREEQDRIRKKLHDLQKTLLEGLREEFDQRENQHLIDLMSREPGDSGDLSLADAVADLNIAMADRQINELRDIDAALGRMREENFGHCMDCSADIGFQRLLAYPTAIRCLACQQRQEQLYAHETRPTF